MRTDRELLELAAKAAGITIYFSDDGSCYHAEMAGNASFRYRSPWNPLAYDGDALRLAVSVPSVNLHWVLMEAWQTYYNEEDRRTYVRRAITIAAAEMAQALP